MLLVSATTAERTSLDGRQGEPPFKASRALTDEGPWAQFLFFRPNLERFVGSHNTPRDNAK